MHGVIQELKKEEKHYTGIRHDTNFVIHLKNISVRYRISVITEYLMH